MIIGHILGDFYAQTDKIAKEKKHSIRMLIKHCLRYGLMLIICSTIFLTKSELLKFMMCILIIGVLHGLTDTLKILIEKQMNLTPKELLYLFILDQIFHTIILILLCKIFNITGGIYVDVFNKNYDVNSFNNILNFIIGILICGRPASIVVKLVFSTFKPKKQDQLLVKIENPKVGSYIGILERVIIFFLGIMSQYSAIGFVLTAKSVARYKQLEDQTFAEKYLVGTLLSTVISIACVGIYNYYKI